MTSKIYLFVLALASAAVLGACGDIERGRPSPVEKDGSSDDDGGTDDGGTDDGGTDDGGTDDGGTTGLSFEADVHAILMEKCSGCHTATNGTALKLSGDPAGDLASVKPLATGGADGTLLKKASAAVSHGGGPVLAAGSGDYTTVLTWITDGMLP